MASGKRINGFQGFAASSSSSSGEAAAHGKEKGIRIYDVAAPEIPRRPSGFSLGVDDGGDDGVVEEVAAPPPSSPLARARGCDVYVGYGGGASVERLVAWLCAEMEALGVRCVAEDRRRCHDAPSHAAARAAMDVAVAGVVVVTPASLGNPYCVDEIRAFADTGRLVPVFVGLGKGDCRVDDVMEKNGDLWGRFGAHLWKVFDGGETEWRAAVDALHRADPAVEVDAAAGDQRRRVIDVLEIVGKRLGRRAVADAVRSWRAAAAAQTEMPLPRNADFVGRESELADLEAVLFGGGDKGKKGVVSLVEVEASGGETFMDGVVCIAGASGAGKTEVVLEYAYRHAMEYKRVLWVQGEARYLRFGYLKLADHLGLAVGDDLSLIAAGDRSGSSSIDGWVFRGIEGDAIAKIRKELTREIPYLLVIDNLESETDWWDSRDVHDLLPCAGVGGRCHVIITTSRLRRVRMVRTFSLPDMAAEEATLLMTKGITDFFGDDAMAAIRAIEEKVRGVPLALALVGEVFAGELAVTPAELRRAMNDAPYRAPTWEESDEPALRDNPGLVQLLEACFALLDDEKDGLGAAAVRMAEAAGFFAPSPIPVPMLAAAATGGERKTRLWKQMKRALRLSCPSRRAAAAAAEPEPLAALLRLGIARRSSPSTPCVTVHRVFALFARKVAVGSGEAAARRAVRAIAAAVEAADDHATDEHAWAACMSVFKFSPAVSVTLPRNELPQFVTRVAVPLAAHAVAAYSSYAAVSDLLVEASDAVRGEEDRHVASGLDAANASVYHELAGSRAELMKLRAKLMLRGGEFALAENHILSAVNILEVVAGEDHPETDAARAALDHILLVQSPEE